MDLERSAFCLLPAVNKQIWVEPPPIVLGNSEADYMVSFAGLFRKNEALRGY